MSTNAKTGDWKRKKRIDHQKLKKSCSAKRRMAGCFESLLDFQINQREIPIRKYKLVQTGAKSDDGGFHDGFFKELNHELLEAFPIKPLIIPVASQSNMAIINLPHATGRCGILYFLFNETGFVIKLFSNDFAKLMPVGVKRQGLYLRYRLPNQWSENSI